MNSNQRYNCVIIDDDEIDRLTSLSLAKKYSFINVSGVFSSAKEALEFNTSNQIDILLSDIDMPEMTGLEFRAKMRNIPVCIFITAYPNYALEGFNVDAFDFLLKPILKERFDHSMNRVQQYFEIKHKAELFEYSLGGNTIYIKQGHQQIKINLHDILYLEALKDYTRIATTSTKYSVLVSLGNLLLEPAFQSFLRIHRSFAVQRHYVDSFSAQYVHIKDVSLPIGRSYKDTTLLNLK